MDNANYMPTIADLLQIKRNKHAVRPIRDLSKKLNLDKATLKLDKFD